MARITKESLLQLSKELEVLTAEETKSFLGGTNSTVQPLGNKKDKEPIYVAHPLPEVVVTPGGGGSQSYDQYMYNLGYSAGYRAGMSEEILDDIILGLGALLSPNSGPQPGSGYDATTYPNTSSYSNGVLDGLTKGHADKDAKKQ
jgi:hypothetical protein